MNYIKLFFGFYLIIFAQYLSAQDSIVFTENTQNNYEFSYSQRPMKNNCVSSYFLHEIAKHIPNNFTSPAYVFSYKMNSIIKELPNNRYKVNIDISDVKCSGNVYYKDFNMSEILSHAYSDFSFEIYSEDGNFSLKKEIYNFNTDSILSFDFVDSVSCNNYKLNITDKTFFYNDLSKNKFNEKKNIINQYYISINLIETAHKRLLKVNLDEFNNYPYIFIEIDEEQRFINFIRNKNYRNILNLKNKDPENFLHDFNNLNILKNQLKINFSNNLNTLKFIFFKDDLMTLAKYYISSVDNQENLLNSENLDNFFSEFYNKEYFNSFEKKFDIIFLKFYNYNDKLLAEFEKNIYELLLKNIDNLILKNNFIEASNNLIFLKKFCQNTKGEYNIDKIELNISKIKYGIFLSYLNIADKALKLESLEMSEKYIELARNYQKNNSEYIISDAYIKKSYSALADKYIEYANQEFEKENYLKFQKFLNRAIEINEIVNIDKNSISEINNLKVLYKNKIYNAIVDTAENYIAKNKLLQAENAISRAIDYQNKNRYKIYSERAVILMSEIKYANYISMIDRAEKLLKYEHYVSVFNILTEAQDYENKYIVSKKDKRLKKLLKKSVEKIILKNLEKANVKAWGNELNQADSILFNSIEMQKKYLLSDIVDINNALEYLKSKIKLKRCQNIDDEYFYNCLKAKEFIKNKNFIIAEKYLKSAILCIKNDTVCNLIDDYAYQALSDFSSAIQYQKYIDSLKNNILDKNFNEFLMGFYDIENYFKKNNIQKFNLEFISLKQYVINFNSPDFTHFCLNNFISKNKYEEALELLKYICKAKWTSIEYQSTFKILAESLAKRDFESNKNLDTEILIEKYTNNNKWFAYFSKQYKLAINRNKIKSIF